MYYKKKETVSYYDCDVKDELKLSAAIRLMQQTSSENLEKLGISVQSLYEEKQVFLLTKTNVKIHRRPKVSDAILIGTAAVAIKGPRFYREFTLEDAEGNHYMDAQTLWILVEPESRKILRPKEFSRSLPLRESITQGQIEDIPIPKLEHEPLKSSQQEICYSMIDVNHHVNNSYYADFVCDQIPYEELLEQGIDTMTLSFEQEALHGDTLTTKTYRLAKGQYAFVGEHSRGQCYRAVVTLKER